MQNLQFIIYILFSAFHYSTFIVKTLRLRREKSIIVLTDIDFNQFEIVFCIYKWPKKRVPLLTLFYTTEDYKMNYLIINIWLWHYQFAIAEKIDFAMKTTFPHFL